MTNECAFMLNILSDGDTHTHTHTMCAYECMFQHKDVQMWRSLLLCITYSELQNRLCAALTAQTFFNISVDFCHRHIVCMTCDFRRRRHRQHLLSLPSVSIVAKFSFSILCTAWPGKIKAMAVSLPYHIRCIQVKTNETLAKCKMKSTQDMHSHKHTRT